MADTYDKKNHVDAIETSAASSQELHHQIRKSLNDIWDEIKSVHADLDELKSEAGGASKSAPRQPPLEAALSDGLRARRVSENSARAIARAVAEKIRESVRDNDSEVSEDELADAVRGVDPEGSEELTSFANAATDAVASAAFEPGRDLPHDTTKLQEARKLLANAAAISSGDAGGSTLKSPPPSVMSSEIMRDVSHLTSLLLGSSPAFAEAMRMQSDAIAYSLAAFNKVGDMQRQDALGLAITARAAASKFDHR